LATGIVCRLDSLECRLKAISAGITDLLSSADDTVFRFKFKFSLATEQPIGIARRPTFAAACGSLNKPRLLEIAKRGPDCPLLHSGHRG
jgi:hypothetical protein